MSDYDNSPVDPMTTPARGDYIARTMESVDALIAKDRATFRKDLKSKEPQNPLVYGTTGFRDGTIAVP